MVTLAVVYALLFCIAYFIPGMWQPIAFIMFWIALGQAFNIFLGLTGYVNFGYVVFIGIGAYGMALAVAGLQTVPFLNQGSIVAGILLAALMAALLSLVVGAVALRLRGAYFAIATIGVNEGFKHFVAGTNLWGGSKGIIISSSLRNIFGAQTSSYISTFLADTLIFAIALTAAFVTFQILRSRFGYALMAIREDEDAAKVIGVHATKYKVIAFVLSTIFAAALGATGWTLKLTYVFPEDVFQIHYTVEAIVIVMLGGAGTLMGPLAGGLIYGALRYYLGTIFPGLQLLILAPILIVVVVAFPEGIVGVLKRKLHGTPLAKYVQ
jgi:branched-chain amino acid transport system permease protein